MTLLSHMLSYVSGWMGMGGEGGTHHDVPITHVELCLWVGWVWVGRVVLTMTLLSHMLSCVSGWDGCGWGGWYSP